MAERYEVTKSICAAPTAWKYMMHIKFTANRGLLCATFLTGVVVAGAAFLPLPYPIKAIILECAALPVGVIFAAICFTTPFRVAVARTEAMIVPIMLRLVNSELLATVVTVGSYHASIARLPCSITSLRAKNMTSWVFAYLPGGFFSRLSAPRTANDGQRKAGVALSDSGFPDTRATAKPPSRRLAWLGGERTATLRAKEIDGHSGLLYGSDIR